jgi:hypothetical protein
LSRVPRFRSVSILVTPFLIPPRAAGRISVRHCEERLRRSNPASRAGHLDCFADARNDAQAAPFSRRAYAPELCLLPRTKDRPLHKKGGEAPKGACQPCAAQHQQTFAPADASDAAARRIGARPPSGASTAALAGTPIPAQLQAMLPGTRNQAGVTRPVLSQSSDSTSRLGRSTEGNDARSRSGAGCEPARKHRTRSTLQIASGMRPSMNEILSRN